MCVFITPDPVPSSSHPLQCVLDCKPQGWIQSGERDLLTKETQRRKKSYSFRLKKFTSSEEDAISSADIQ